MEKMRFVDMRKLGFAGYGEEERFVQSDSNADVSRNTSRNTSCNTSCSIFRWELGRRVQADNSCKSAGFYGPKGQMERNSCNNTGIFDLISQNGYFRVKKLHLCRNFTPATCLSMKKLYKRRYFLILSGCMGLSGAQQGGYCKKPDH
jgi:hypothetical protein